MTGRAGAATAALAVLALSALGCAQPSRPATRPGTTPPPASTTATRTPAKPTTPTPATPVPPATRTVPRGTAPTPTATPSGPASWLLGRDWTRIPTSRRVVALTFDAGANADGVRPILAALASQGVPATFFLTGNWVRQYPAQARAIAGSYRVGNHSVSHPYLTTLTDTRLRAQVVDAAAAIRQVTGADPAPLFRFPYGDVDARVIAAVNRLGYVPVRWTVDTLGWKGTSGGITATTVRQRVLAALVPGEIVLMHLGSHPQDHSLLDAAALPGLIGALRARGYQFVTLDALVG